MALPKYARKLTINGQSYRWLVGAHDSWMEDGRPWEAVLQDRRLTVVVQHASGHGQKLVFFVPVYRTTFHRSDVVTPLGSGSRLCSIPKQQLEVSPSLVRRFVERALLAGWKPSERGPDFQMQEDL
jgi:hypothetical protein